MQKTFAFLFAIATLSCAFCTYSGVKFGIDTQIFKAITKVDFNKFLQNKTLLNHTSINGTFLFKYEIDIDNLNVVEVKAPSSVDVQQSINEAGFRQVHLDVKGIYAAIRLDFGLKYGIFKDSGKQVLVTADVTSVNGDFYFNEKGEVIILAFNVELGKVTIDFKSGFYKFLYNLTKHLILSQIQKAIAKLNGTISDAINKWVNEEFLYDLGFGIGFNFTNIDRPVLLPYTKENVNGYVDLFVKLATYLLSNEAEKKEFINSLETTILTCGLHGSIYPNLSPEIKPDIDPAVNMTYVSEYFDNEIQILISDYTLNTLLFMGQQTGYLHMEFTTATNKLFPFDFNTQALATVIPEFGVKYPTDKFEVLMKAAIAINKNIQPKIVSTPEGTKLVINFGLDFDTTVSDDPFDDPVKDLKLNITSSLDLGFEIKDNVLSLIISNFKVDNIDKQVDELNLNVENFKALIVKEFEELILPILNGYVKNIKVVELLKSLLGIEFTNLRIVPKDSYLVLSVGIAN